MYCWMSVKKTGLIFIYKSILVEIVINMFVYNSPHYFPNTAHEWYRSVIRRQWIIPFLNTAITWASFQFVEYLLYWRDLLNIICKGNAFLFGHIFNILWLMTSGPDALFGWRIWIMSEISSTLTLRSIIILFVFNSIWGRGAFASSGLDIKLKYFFSRSHFS
jgi:hypothetical protein